MKIYIYIYINAHIYILVVVVVEKKNMSIKEVTKNMTLEIIECRKSGRP